MDNEDNKEYGKKLYDEVKDLNYKKFSSFLFTLNPYEFTSLSFIIGMLIAPRLTSDEQGSLGNWLQLLGQVLITISGQAQLQEPDGVSSEDFKDFKKEVQKEFDSLLKKY